MKKHTAEDSLAVHQNRYCEFSLIRFFLHEQLKIPLQHSKNVLLLRRISSVEMFDDCMCFPVTETA